MSSILSECLEVAGKLRTSPEVCPPHPLLRYRTCLRCQQELPLEETEITVSGEKEPSATWVAFDYIEKGLILHPDFANRVRAAALSRAMETKKLSLVLDLDNTLIHSIRKGLWSNRPVDSARGLFDISVNAVRYVVKLRPLVAEFLEAMSAMYDMHVYTAASEAYARAVASALDPAGAYFHETRVISRDTCAGKKKKGLDLVLRDPSTAVIADDYWPAWRVKDHKNVLRIRPYAYAEFQRITKKQKADQPAAKPEAHVVHDDLLVMVGNFLGRVHAAFFDGGGGGDVRVIMREVCGAVLLGCVILFEEDVAASARELAKWVRRATRLGARCVSKVGEEVTHVVAGDPTTEKCRWAEKMGMFVVSLEWVEEAFYRNWRPSEVEFSMKSASTGSNHS